MRLRRYAVSLPPPDNPLDRINIRMSESTGALKATPLNAVHRKMGAKMVDFGGWDMPVQYSGIIEEHHTVRQRVGLFDVSHMGEIEISGPDAFALTDSVTTNAV